MPPRFVVDAMLGTLARWLRLLGYDALYFRALEDAALAERARRDGRVLVTRDRELARCCAAGRAVLIRSQRLGAQWTELARACRLRPSLAQSLTRCALCNLELRPLPREQARALVPPYVHATRRRFRRCPGCGRVFWRATHLRDLSSRLRELVRAARPGARGAGSGQGGSRPRAGSRRAVSRPPGLKPAGSAPGRRARRSP